MSRLEAAINRLIAQKTLLEHVADLIGKTPGPVFELGLGNGRTYDHLRQIFPEREIFAFDQAIRAHAGCIPDAAHMVVGDMRDTLRLCHPRIAAKPVLIHVDMGSGDPTADLATREWLSPLVADWAAEGGYVVTDRPLQLPGFTTIERPSGAPASPHLVYRRMKG
ncbi:class I SAM-dependent methyltransferase [Afifella pfennigii]|uniref:class I SAM-dependent methyltransferase n=1 Tax=Afifella pfennigii TaxID=209897 RepID=UPI00054E33CD|nr:class I SAM-dependent methyltransferase [Afifella pfennigii]